jgi:glycerol-3-phosphate cytidylyltransferase
MKLVLTYGTFDILHRGHLHLLRRARALGDRLYVGLSTDDFNRLKNKHAEQSYQERYEFLRMCKHVDYIFPETCWEQKANDIVTFDAKVFVMGDDWRGHFDHLKSICEVLYLPRTPEISSTLIRNDFHMPVSAVAK